VIIHSKTYRVSEKSSLLVLQTVGLILAVAAQAFCDAVFYLLIGKIFSEEIAAVVAGVSSVVFLYLAFFKNGYFKETPDSKI
jgi:hypothetical protein